MSRYSFSGHESFTCKSLWLKKGYDYLLAGLRFTDENAVVELGVGKNMVASIRYWLRAFGLTHDDRLQPIARYIFDTEAGCDPFAEDETTLWVLHFLLVWQGTASIYSLLFEHMQRERRQFTKTDLENFIRRKCSVPEQKNVFNLNTVRKDMGVLLRNYVAPGDLKSIEDFSSLLIGLNLIVHQGGERYAFRSVRQTELRKEVVLFAMLRMKGDDNTLSLDHLQRLALIFCLPLTELIETVRLLAEAYPDLLVYSDNSGIKNVQFLQNRPSIEALDYYYRML
ncbi:MAG: DUF4007 family protein [Muribaculaceae bacterium]|nr:DUF4007 family protein [Muribaculaceae bacterium]MDE7081213.1 DUF4007 family protein [Muribaculaceae bacterium]